MQEIGAFHREKKHIVNSKGVPELDGAGGVEVDEVVEEIGGGRVADYVNFLEDFSSG